MTRPKMNACIYEITQICDIARIIQELKKNIARVLNIMKEVK